MATALRSKSTTNIAIAGTTIAHGLNQNGTGLIPDDVIVLSSIATAAGQTYRYAAHDATNVYLANGTAAGSADVTCIYHHTIVRL